MGGASFQFDPESLKPIINAAVEETLARIDAAKLPADQEVFTESEAAAWLRLKPHQLRDERLRGRISASQILGRRIRYTRADLLAYLGERKWTG